MFLIFPTILVSPASTSYMRTGRLSQTSSRWRIAREKIGDFLTSPVGRAIPELHMIAFLFRGRFFELARRVTGMSYVSLTSVKPSLTAIVSDIGSSAQATRANPPIIRTSWPSLAYSIYPPYAPPSAELAS